MGISTFSYFGHIIRGTIFGPYGKNTYSFEINYKLPDKEAVQFCTKLPRTEDSSGPIFGVVTVLAFSNSYS